MAFKGLFTDTTPKISWTYSDPESELQSSYQVQIDRASTFDSNSGSPDYDSGEVSSANAYHTTSALSVSGLLYSRTRVKDTVYDSYTKLLLHCDGTDGSTTFTDEIGTHTVTANGNAQIDTAQKKFGTASGLFDGTGDYLSVPDSADWDFGTGDFTIDFWVRWNNVAFTTLFDRTVSILHIKATGTSLNVYLGGIGYGFSWSPSANIWYHVAVTRAGTNLRAFVDGTQIGSTQTSSDDSSGTESLYIGAFGTDSPVSESLDGWMDEIRISKGIARWTANFTPPTSAYAKDTPGNWSSWSGPDTFVLDTNAEGITDDTPRIKFTGSTDADSDDLHYQIQVGTEPTFASPILDKLSYTSTTGWEYWNGSSWVAIPAPDTYTKLLLHCDGTDGSTTFTDSGVTGHTVTANGNAQIDTAQKKFGTGSFLSDGTDDYLTVPDHNDWDMGTGDFTVDFWVRFNTVYDDITFVGQTVDGNNWWQCAYMDVGGISKLKFKALVGGVVKAEYEVAWSPSANTWYHLEFTRNGVGAYIFIDGVSQTLTETVAFGTNDITSTGAGLLYIGGGTGAGLEIDGWMDEVRVSKGIARHTSNFTPPTSAYSNPKGGVPNVYAGNQIRYQVQSADAFADTNCGSLYVRTRAYDVTDYGSWSDPIAGYDYSYPDNHQTPKLWSRLGSDSDITSPVIGSAGTAVNSPSYAAGKFGNGLDMT